MLITIVIVNSNLINYVMYNCVGSIEFCVKSLDYNEDYREEVKKIVKTQMQL